MAPDQQLFASYAALRYSLISPPMMLPRSIRAVISMKKNARAFRKHLAPYIEHARKAGSAPRRRPGQTAASRQRSGDVRAWAKDQGIAVSARGRIPASLVERYRAAARRP